VAVDWDRLRLAILATNAEVLGFDDRVMLIQADLKNFGLRFPPRSGAFFDLARRSGYQCLRSVIAYQHPLQLVLTRAAGRQVAIIVELLESEDCLCA